MNKALIVKLQDLESCTNLLPAQAMAYRSSWQQIERLSAENTKLRAVYKAAEKLTARTRMEDYDPTVTWAFNDLIDAICDMDSVSGREEPK